MVMVKVRCRELEPMQLKERRQYRRIGESLRNTTCSQILKASHYSALFIGLPNFEIDREMSGRASVGETLWSGTPKLGNICEGSLSRPTST